MNRNLKLEQKTKSYNKNFDAYDERLPMFNRQTYNVMLTKLKNEDRTQNVVVGEDYQNMKMLMKQMGHQMVPKRLTVRRALEYLENYEPKTA